MRCPDCQKFVGLETSEPEMESEDLSDGQVSFSVRLTRNCAECGQELKETTFELSDDHSDDLETHIRENHPAGEELTPTFSLEVGSLENTESGGSRYAKNMIGVAVDYEIHCDSCPSDNNVAFSGQLSDEIPASAFDEMV